MPDRALKIDVHTHVLPDALPDLSRRYGCGGFVSLEHHRPGCAWMMRDGRPFREITDNSWSAARRIEECDRDGVDVQVLSTVPVMFCYGARPEHGIDLARLLNDHIAGMVRDHPRRFVGLGTLPLQAPELACRELERCVGELGLAGVQIGTHVNDWNLEAPELFAVFQEAERLGAAVFVHPWDMLGAERMRRYWMPWLVGMPAETSLAICSMIFGGVLERLPRLKVAFAHGGGSFAATLGRIEHGFAVRPDLVAVDNPVNPRRYLGRFWVDSLVHDPQVLRHIIGLLGASRVMLGSDYPFPLGEARPGSLIESLEELGAADRAALLGGSAIEFLGLDRCAFA